MSVNALCEELAEELPRICARIELSDARSENGVRKASKEAHACAVDATLLGPELHCSYEQTEVRCAGYSTIKGD